MDILYAEMRAGRAEGEKLRRRWSNTTTFNFETEIHHISRKGTISTNIHCRPVMDRQGTLPAPSLPTDAPRHRDSPHLQSRDAASFTPKHMALSSLPSPRTFLLPHL